MGHLVKVCWPLNGANYPVTLDLYPMYVVAGVMWSYHFLPFALNSSLRILYTYSYPMSSIKVYDVIVASAVHDDFQVYSILG